MSPSLFEIHGLFGRSNTIQIDLSKKARIIFGINGSGKTTVFRLLHALLKGRIHEFRSTNFELLKLHIDDGSTIILERGIHTANKRPDRRSYKIALALISPNGKTVHSTCIDDEIELPDRIPLNVIEHEIPELSRVGPREWIDSVTGELLTTSDVIEKHSDRFPWLQSTTKIEWYKTIINRFPVKLIQTQRLMTLKADLEKYQPRSNARYQNTVVDYSERLRDLIRDKLSDSMQMAQSLDSSYPRRLLQEHGFKRLDDEELMNLLDETEALGAKLRKVELLSRGDNVDIKIESISEENRRAISLYLSDSLEKYKALQPFADKLLLFLEIVNSKFRPAKYVEIGGREGFRIGLANGGSIHPGLLSSGEQHEIVLLFDLIFFSEPGTLVLIDEPEISLHIDWQMKFLADVEAIGKASDLRFLLATHSPAIIGNRVDICQEI